MTTFGVDVFQSAENAQFLCLSKGMMGADIFRDIVGLSVCWV